MRGVTWTLALAVGCSQYEVKAVRQDSGNQSDDSGDCIACGLDDAIASDGMADAACQAAAEPVVSPFEIEVKAELFVDLFYDDEHVGGLQPLVADLDADGMPEIVVVDYDQNYDFGELVVFDSAGVRRWVRPAADWQGTFLLADVDNGDGAEVVAVICDEYVDKWEGDCPNQRMSALDADGVELWTQPEDRHWTRQTARVGDLAGEGHPVLIQRDELRDLASGSLVGRLDVDAVANSWFIFSSAVADADGDGTLEIAARGALFDATGAQVWALSGNWEDSYAVSLQADTDDLPEFLFFGHGWKLVEGDGTEITTVHLGELAVDGSPPVVADLDGDGATEIAFSGTTASGLAAYELDGSELWRTQDGYYRSLGGWDVDADGAIDLITIEDVDNDTDNLRILDGRTGDILYELQIANVSGWSPFAADIDNDGHAELLIPGGTPREGPLPSVTILHQVNDTWPAAGPSWPERDFQISNIGPAGQVPRGETNPPSWAYNVFHARPATNPAGVNLTPTIASVCADTCAGTVEIQVQLTNTGPVTSPESALQLQADDTVVSETTVQPIEPGVTTESLTLTVPADTFDLGEVRIVTDPAGVLEECHEEDNMVVVPDPR